MPLGLQHRGTLLIGLLSHIGTAPRNSSAVWNCKESQAPQNLDPNSPCLQIPLAHEKYPRHHQPFHNRNSALGDNLELVHDSLVLEHDRRALEHGSLALEHGNLELEHGNSVHGRKMALCSCTVSSPQFSAPPRLFGVGS